MRLIVVTFLAVVSLPARDELRLALEAKAQADFDRVQRSISPQLRDATLCIQSQASLIPVTGREGLSTVHYRKGYCTLATAVSTRQASDFLAAAADFDK